MNTNISQELLILFGESRVYLIEASAGLRDGRGAGLFDIRIVPRLRAAGRRLPAVTC
jgi:hypothetical protein